MQTLHGANDTIVHLLLRLDVLMSERPDDAELDDKPASQCDEELCALQSGQKALRSVQEALKRRISLVSRKRNTFPPINTLPPELLVDIFAIAIDDDGSGSIRSDHATLSLVCQHWNHLVGTTPSLWTKIHAGRMSAAKIIRALEKSQNAPLDIKGTSWLFEPGEQSAFLNVIIPYAHRWREVILKLEQAQTLKLKSIATLSMPFLEDLDLSLSEPFAWVGEKPLDLFGGRPSPRLQKLRLVRIPVPWSPTILCHLKLLSISQIGRLGPSLDQFMAVLSACPDLESLAISKVSFPGGVSTSSPNPIHMPALATLELRMLTTEITNRLLASIHAPNHTSGELYCDVLGDPLQTLFTSDVSHFFDHTRSNRSVCSIICDTGRFTINLMGPWFITISVENMTFAKDTRMWLSPQSRIHLIISGLNPPLDELVAVSANMEEVFRITFGYGTPVSGALTLLATCSLVQGRTRWLFPALEEMSIASDIVGDGDELEKLLLMLRRRKEAQETHDNTRHAMPLRRLRLGLHWYTGADDPAIVNFSSTYWPNRLDEVRRLLGPEGELIWYGRIVTGEGVLEDRVVSLGGS